MIKDPAILIQNIYYMLVYAHGMLQHQDYLSMDTENFENLEDMFAAVLARGMSQQLKRGLHRDYVEHQSSLPVLRGKVDLTGSIRLLASGRRSLECVYDEYTEDNQLNRILKATAEFLCANRDVKQQTRSEIRQSLRFMSNISSADISAIKWSGFHYHRSNATYRMLMNICFLVSQNLLLSSQEGSRRLARFVDSQDMHRLYEKFILEYYRYHHALYSPASRDIYWLTESADEYLPKMRADVVLSSGKKRLVIDAKYYSSEMQSYHGAETIRSGHLYQMFAYIKNEDKHQCGDVSGLLLYARTANSVLPQRDYLMGQNMLSVRSLNLNVSFKELQRQLEEIVIHWQSAV